VNRRTFLRSAGATGLAASSVATAGCLGSALDGEPTPGGTPFADHEATVGIEDQPRKGELGGSVVLAFEDPSCPRCRTFEQQTVPDIEENLVATGRGAYVVRTYPVVYPWGDLAVHALEATYDRDADAFWSLFSHYFARQSSFDSDNVLDRTAAFLNGETDVDGDAVVADAESGAYDGAVQTDLDAGMNADVGRTTPTVLLFRDGRYVTRASGSVSYDVIGTALGVE
jgi:protein-disulfide isomerase